MVCLSCTATGERVCLAAEGFGNRHCFLENIADKVIYINKKFAAFIIQHLGFSEYTSGLIAMCFCN